MKRKRATGPPRVAGGSRILSWAWFGWRHGVSALELPGTASTHWARSPHGLRNSAASFVRNLMGDATPPPNGSAAVHGALGPDVRTFAASDILGRCGDLAQRVSVRAVGAARRASLVSDVLAMLRSAWAGDNG